MKTRVFLHPFRGCFSEAVDSLIPMEDRGELKRLYGDDCFDEPKCEIESKKKSFMLEQFANMASFRRKSLTVDDWLGFCEIPAADSLYSNGFVRLWHADDPDSARRHGEVRGSKEI